MINPTWPVLKRIVSIYGGASLIGLTLVSFPASSGFLKDAHGLSDQAYGSIFLPQLVAAIAGALMAGVAVKRLRLKSIYLIALASLALSQLFLFLSFYLPPTGALLIIMCGTACFGFGFGFGGGPLNGLATLLFPAHRGTALTALHMMAGVGLVLGPLLVSLLVVAGYWYLAPASLLAIAVAFLLLTSSTDLPSQTDTAGPAGSGAAVSRTLPYRDGYFQILILISVLYALSEGTFSNWAVIFLESSKGLSGTAAGTALAAFWGGLTIGRLVVSFIVLRIQAYTVWLVLPCLMIAAFVVLPGIETPLGAIAAFSFAGLACSAFFPLMVAVGSQRYPEAVSWLASMLTAALMLGVGVGSYAIGALVEKIPLQRIYYLSAVFPLISLILVLLTRRLAGRS